MQSLAPEIQKALSEATEQHDGFMDYAVDSDLLPQLLEWISDDWQRLRILLNYVQCRGEQVALRYAKGRLAGLSDNAEFRMTETWEYRLNHPDWYKSNKTSTAA